MHRSRQIVILLLLLIAVAAAIVFAWPSEQQNRLKAGASVIVAVLSALAAVAEITGLFNWFGRGRPQRQADTQHDVGFEITCCGDKPIELGAQRLSISSAFGMYFVGLLERDQSYIHMDRQIEILGSRDMKNGASLCAIYRELTSPTGSRILVLESEGGMGKSTLAARIVRCLYEQEAIDMILGDSAKAQTVDVFSGEVMQTEPGYYDAASFHERLREQLGLPKMSPNVAIHQHTQQVKGRLLGRRSIIVVDNLETIATGDQLLDSLRALASRDTRIVVTTRRASGLAGVSKVLLIHLRPLLDLHDVSRFLRWHIARYRHIHRRLSVLEEELGRQQQIKKLIDRTGGIPLLIQIVTSDVARLSWDRLNALPDLYGCELLDYLYRQAWDELGAMGDSGDFAKQILQWVAARQYSGHRISSATMQQWADQMGTQRLLASSLDLLYERFLIMNNDLRSGSFSIVPSLVEFLRQK